MSSAPTEPLSSPALSFCSSSFEVMSPEASSPPYDSDDEIVWALSSSAMSMESTDSRSTGSDFVVLSRVLSPSNQQLVSGASSPVSDSASDLSSTVDPVPSTDLSSVFSSPSPMGNPAGSQKGKLKKLGGSSVASTSTAKTTPLTPLMPSRVTNVDCPTPTPALRSGALKSVRQTKSLKATLEHASMKATKVAKFASERTSLAEKATAKAKAARARAQVTAGKSENQVKADKEAAVNASRKARSARKRARKANLKAKEAEVAAAAYQSPVQVNSQPELRTTTSPATPMASVVGLGSRPLVDDSVSEVASERGDGHSSYVEASEFITSFISDPETAQTRSKVHRLALLQSLIIELGISTTAMLPQTITAAKALVKSTVFINITDYLSTRSQGPDALKRILLPSRKALIKDIRTKGSTPRQFVKAHGLQALLIHC